MQPVYMIKTKVVFFEGPTFFSQSELFDYFLNCSEWLAKSRPSKSHICFDHVNKLMMSLPFTTSLLHNILIRKTLCDVRLLLWVSCTDSGLVARFVGLLCC